MKKVIILLSLTFWSCLAGYSAETKISGKVDGGNGMTVRLMAYSDHLSNLRNTLATAVIGEDEGFYFVIELEETTYAWLDVEFRQADIFLQPGQTYEVLLKPEQNAISSSYYDRSALPMTLMRDDAEHLNAFISDFNELYNDFLLNYAENIRVKGSASSYNAFRTAISLRFKNASNSYFKDYMKYKSASMEMFLRLKSRDKLGQEYLTGQPLACNNIEYMDFFHLYFEKYFISGNKYFNFNKTYDMINGSATLSAILDSLGADPVLTTTGLKELVLLSGLKELYQAQGFDRDRIMGLIKEIAATGTEEIIRKIAVNLSFRVNRLKPASQAPDFTLPEVYSGNEISLSGLKGKYVYLAFFDSRNPASQAELAMISELYDDYKTRVEFIAISVDKDPSIIKGNPNIPPQTWVVLHYDNHLEVLENYDAIAYPYFVLIDDQGRIVSCTSPSPSENIRKALEAI